MKRRCKVRVVGQHTVLPGAYHVFGGSTMPYTVGPSGIPLMHGVLRLLMRRVTAIGPGEDRFTDYIWNIMKQHKVEARMERCPEFCAPLSCVRADDKEDRCVWLRLRDKAVVLSMALFGDAESNPPNFARSDIPAGLIEFVFWIKMQGLRINYPNFAHSELGSHSVSTFIRSSLIRFVCTDKSKSTRHPLLLKEPKVHPYRMFALYAFLSIMLGSGVILERWEGLWEFFMLELNPVRAKRVSLSSRPHQAWKALAAQQVQLVSRIVNLARYLRAAVHEKFKAKGGPWLPRIDHAPLHGLAASPADQNAFMEDCMHLPKDPAISSESRAMMPYDVISSNTAVCSLLAGDQFVSASLFGKMTHVMTLQNVAQHSVRTWIKQLCPWATKGNDHPLSTGFSKKCPVATVWSPTEPVTLLGFSHPWGPDAFALNAYLDYLTRDARGFFQVHVSVLDVLCWAPWEYARVPFRRFLQIAFQRPVNVNRAQELLLAMGKVCLDKHDEKLDTQTANLAKVLQVVCTARKAHILKTKWSVFAKAIQGIESSTWNKHMKDPANKDATKLRLGKILTELFTYAISKGTHMDLLEVIEFEESKGGEPYKLKEMSDEWVQLAEFAAHEPLENNAPWAFRKVTKPDKPENHFKCTEWDTVQLVLAKLEQIARPSGAPFFLPAPKRDKPTRHPLGRHNSVLYYTHQIIPMYQQEQGGSLHPMLASWMERHLLFPRGEYKGDELQKSWKSQQSNGLGSLTHLLS